MFRIVGYSLVLFFLDSLPAAAAKRSPPLSRPNVIIVIADQWRAQTFGFAGDPNVKTPHLDRLAQCSSWFVNAVAGLPVCSPTRASLLTGRRPLSHGVFLNDVPLSSDATSLAGVLGSNGYDTAYIGKWHLNGDGRSAFIPRERRQGFDYWKVLECTHDYNHSAYYGDGSEKLFWDGYDAIAQTRDAIQYLKDHSRTAKPFLLVLAWGPPHDPYQTAPAGYRSKYDPAQIKLRPNVPVEIQSTARQRAAGYYAHCSALDDCLGQLRQMLEETGLDRTSILIFTADHGDLLGSHGAYNKQQPYDESIRVPFLIHCPAGLGIKPRKLSAPINSEDIMPTILGLCGVSFRKSLPSDRGRLKPFRSQDLNREKPLMATVDGIDYSRYLRGGKNPSDGATIISCIAPFGQWTRKAGGREYRGIRTVRYTYVRDLNGPWLLFDNEQDPFQLNNLIGKPDFRRLEKSLDATLKRKLMEANDSFLPAQEYIRSWGYVVDDNGTVPYTP